MGTKQAGTKDSVETYNAFAKYRKVKACLDSTGLPFVGHCYTCGKRYHISFLQCGHAKGGRSNFLLCNRFLTDAQCKICNMNMHGRSERFQKKLKAQYGEEFIERLLIRAERKIMRDANINWPKHKKKFERWLARDLRAHGYKTYGELLKATPEMME